ncbi:hypothetical protein [Roseimaritima sediminicola]|uniref:hypothetical protein n=1 Tax=Roseimaritima sediminicola TaxID=2662066 RepID=UPI001F2D7514|nr:hypothetical protein [Roseimaritima sediminicola]
MLRRAWETRGWRRRLADSAAAEGWLLPHPEIFLCVLAENQETGPDPEREYQASGTRKGGEDGGCSSACEATASRHHDAAPRHDGSNYEAKQSAGDEAGNASVRLRRDFLSGQQDGYLAGAQEGTKQHQNTPDRDQHSVDYVKSRSAAARRTASGGLSEIAAGRRIWRRGL